MINLKANLLVLILLSPFFLKSQENDYFNDNYLRYSNHTYKTSIQTILLYRQGWELSYPFINLNSDEKLAIQFDDLAEKSNIYSYTIIHCTSNWQPSDLIPSDYIEGFTTNQITDYVFSVNTLCKYVHYQVAIPNENLKITLSGNYVLLVYEGFDQEKPVFTRRFVVVEQKVNVTTDVHKASSPELRSTSQEVDFAVNLNNCQVSDPLSEIHVTLAQNNRWDNSRVNLKPSFLDQYVLTYNYERENVFPGGKEFRYFDLKSIKFKTERVESIVLDNPYYSFSLISDAIYNKNVYSFNEDLNGKRLIKIDGSEHSESDADYVYVKFRLPYPAPIINGNVYVFGGLTDWNINKINMLYYNNETKMYELTILLKQGYYNYKYVCLKDNENQPDEAFIEGSSSDAENDYLVYVYYRDPSKRYDQLIGLKIVNSMKRY